MPGNKRKAAEGAERSQIIHLCSAKEAYRERTTSSCLKRNTLYRNAFRFIGSLSSALSLFSHHYPPLGLSFAWKVLHRWLRYRGNGDPHLIFLRPGYNLVAMHQVANCAVEFIRLSRCFLYFQGRIKVCSYKGV